MTSLNTFKSKTKIKVGSRDYSIFSLKLAEENGLENISKLPKSLKVLTENLLRKEDEKTVTKSDINAMTSWLVNKKSNTEISFYPSRVMM